MSLVRFCKSLWSHDSARKSSRRTARRRFLSEHSYFRSLHLEELEGRRLLATFIVDRTDDVAGATACTAAANDCSLRGAITAANANGTGADTITFDASTNGTPFTLALANAGGANEDANATGDLDVNGSLTITGNGSSNTIIQAGTNTTNGIDKVFAFNPLCTTAMSFSVSGVTIRHGRNTQPFGAVDFSHTGGGLDFCGTGASSFSISNSIIANNTNTTAYGGGMNIDEAFPATSTITITNTQFTNNTSLMWGGGLNIFGDNGNTTITGSTFSGNQTLGTGGVGAQGGGINIRVTNQNDGDGAPTPVVSISNSTITSNTGVGFGGGIDVAGASNQDVNISNTAITGNSLIVVAGGVTNTVGGGLDHSNNAARTTTLTNVLIANNQSTGAGGSHGGGVAHGSGNLILRNTTVSGNSATGDGGGVYVTVGLVPTQSAGLRLRRGT
jgi:predicted outer membrane repeat protein